MIKIDLDIYPKDVHGEDVLPTNERGERTDKVKLSILLSAVLSNGNDPVNGEKFGDWADGFTKEGLIDVDETDYNILVGIINTSTLSNFYTNRLIKTLRACKEKAV